MVLSEVAEVIFLTIARLVLFRTKCPESSKTFTSCFPHFHMIKGFALAGVVGERLARARIVDLGRNKITN